jgi:hypothetical protein
MKSMLLMFLPVIAEAAFDRAYIAAYVFDAVDRAPLSGVKMVARFEDDIGWRAWTEEANPDIIHGRTDINGFCRLSGRTNCGKSSCWIEEAPIGYYKPYHGSGIIKYESRSLLGVWQPDNVVATLALQRVEHPIPLYVNRIILDGGRECVGGFDGTNAVLKFDFLVGDWLPPHGTGKYSDMTITTKLEIGEALNIWRSHKTTFYDFISAIELPGKGNGLVEKSVRGSNCGIRIRTAPESGYVSEKVMQFGRRKKNTSGPVIHPEYYTESDDDRCYCFRVRSRFDEKGNLVEAYYGKIYGDFRFRGTDKSGFNGASFLYYLNPTSLDRNLEWDMKNNLCKKPLRMDYESIGVRYREP